jgi:hypothetical protein
MELETFRFRDGEPAVLLLDYDQKGISGSARALIESSGGFEGAITSLIPTYPALARVTRASTSAGLRNEETGETFPGNGGQHVYLFAQNGADIPRFLKDLQKRAWLNGLGWILVAGRGALLARSIVDVTVGSPERLVFEGPPSILAPLAQDQDARRPVAHEGETLDTAAACPPLRPEEERGMPSWSRRPSGRRSQRSIPPRSRPRRRFRRAAASTWRRRALSSRPARKVSCGRGTSCISMTKVWERCPSPTSSPIRNDSTARPWPIRSRAGTTVAAKGNCSGMPTTQSS